jgi:hypothetical protein
VLSPPAELILYCGVSIGYENTTTDHTRTPRSPLDETITFIDG